MNTIRVSISWDPDKIQHFVGHDMGPNRLQRLSADDTNRQRVNHFIFEGTKLNYLVDSLQTASNLIPCTETPGLHVDGGLHCLYIFYLSHDMRFPIWFIRPAKAQTSLRKCAV